MHWQNIENKTSNGGDKLQPTFFHDENPLYFLKKKEEKFALVLQTFRALCY